MLRELFGILVLFGILAIFFWIIESLWPEDRAQPRWRKDSGTDFIWFVTGPFFSFLTPVLMFIVILVLSPVLIKARPTFVTALPAWLQIISLLLIAGFFSYWIHRAFHKLGWLWRIHSVHHSPEKLDWLASARVHPLNNMGDALVAVPLFYLGFNVELVAAYLPFLTLYAIFVHSNISWNFGFLKYLITTPEFHRWHHSADREALDKNFSGLFPVYDWLFGTLYLPARQRPRSYGLYLEQMPRGFIRQLLYPFRRKPARFQSQTPIR